MSAIVPGTLIGAPLRLGQMLITLVNNAVKLTDDGEIVTTIRTLELGDNGANI